MIVRIYGTNTDTCYEVAKSGFHAKSRKTSESYRALEIYCYGAMMTRKGVFLIKDEMKITSVYKIPASEYRYACIENYTSEMFRNKRELSQLMEEIREGYKNGRADYN